MYQPPVLFAAVFQCVMAWTGFFELALTISSLSPFKLVIPLKSELAVELLEKGRVRFWLQAEKISANGKVDYVFNDNLLSQGEVSKRKLILSKIHMICK